jgi:16S rRNA (cytidine1402-2'-O)-methyltransferase
VVSTPIGNKDDITLRALQILNNVDVIAAEDTRHTGRLLSHYQIKANMISYHDHNKKERTPKLINRLEKGDSVALVSNAGTPTVSDPGYQLITTAIANSITVIPIPGVSAVTTAISVCGLPTDSYVFAGFLSKKKGKRLQQLKELTKDTRTVVFYESPKRILKLVEEIMAAMGDRYGILAREMTKIHEEFIRGCLSEIRNRVKERADIKGECTLLVKGYEKKTNVSSKALQDELREGLENKTTRLTDLAKKTAKKHGISKSAVYGIALRIKEKT